MSYTPAQTQRVQGVDSIRFVSALWVFLAHCGAPPIFNPFEVGTFWFAAFRGTYNCIWSGAPAVIVFFVISGFCIHFPYSDSKKPLAISQFYSRRYIRILIPVSAALPLSYLTPFPLTVLHDSILWSILAEMIYYLLYPILRKMRILLGSWRGLLIAAFVSAFLMVIALDPSAKHYPSFGPRLNWVIGLPCWIMGCVVAERIREVKTASSVSTCSIWIWRGGVIFMAWICTVLRFHSPLGYPWTLNFFAILAAFWLEKEIKYRRKVSSNHWFEAGGLWSYSLYLFHLPIWLLLVTHIEINEGYLPGWLLMSAFVLSFCYLFYLIIERPAHNIARKVGILYER